MFSVWFAYNLRIVSVRYKNSNIAHVWLIQHPMNMFRYHQVQSTLTFVMHTHYYVICVSLAWISSAIVLISFPNCLKPYMYQCIIMFPFSKLNLSQNGQYISSFFSQYILLLCHDNPPEVSIIARFCTNFSFVKIWRGPRLPTNHIGFLLFLTVKHMKTRQIIRYRATAIPCHEEPFPTQNIWRSNTQSLGIEKN